VENGNKKEWLLGNVPKSHFFSEIDGFLLLSNNFYLCAGKKKSQTLAHLTVRFST
jgi:hypothetical protein